MGCGAHKSSALRSVPESDRCPFWQTGRHERETREIAVQEGPRPPTSSVKVRDVPPTKDLSAFDVVIDVRSEEERNSSLGYIASSRHVDMQQIISSPNPLLSHNVATDAKILMVCRSGMRSGATGKYLAEHGFTRVHNLVGGMLGWEKSNLPRVISNPTQVAVPILTPCAVRDSIIVCFVDATYEVEQAKKGIQLEAGSLDDEAIKHELKQIFEQEHEGFSHPTIASLTKAITAMGEAARSRGHPLEMITQYTSEFLSVLKFVRENVKSTPHIQSEPKQQGKLPPLNDGAPEKKKEKKVVKKAGFFKKK